MVLKRSEKNELLKLVAGSPLRSDDFRLAQDDHSTVVNHPASESSFSISKDWAVSLSTISKIGNAQNVDLHDTWSSVKLTFGRWLDDVKAELETPDLWEELRRGSELISESARSDLANTPFTVPEQEQISAQLKEIRTQVAELCSLTEEQSARMEERFDQAEDASRRLGRKDCILLFGGAMLSLVVSAVVPPEVLQHALTMTAQRLGHLFVGGPPQLPPQAS